MIRKVGSETDQNPQNWKIFIIFSIFSLKSTISITEPELNIILVITEHFLLIPVTAQYCILPLMLTELSCL